MKLLSKLTLRNFGKFTRNTFEFGEVTVFRGDNESGKTTLFDALTVAICGGKRTGDLGRYVNLSGVTPEWVSDTVVKMSKDDFLGLYAIRAGDVLQKFDKGSWVKDVSAKLFTGGIAPEAVISALDHDYVATGKAQPYMKALNPITVHLGKLQEELSSKVQERESILREEEQLAHSVKGLDELTNAKADLDKKISTLGAERARGEQIQRRAENMDTLKLIAQVHTSKEQLKKCIAFVNDETETLRIAREKITDAKHRHEQAIRSYTDAQQQFDNLTKESAKQTVHIENKKRLADTASKLLDEINNYRPVQTTTSIINIPLLIAGILALITGLVLSTVLLPGILRWVGMGVSAIAGACMIFFSRSTKVQLDVNGEKHLIARVKDSWIVSGGDNRMNDISTLSGLSSFLNQSITAYNTSIDLQSRIISDSAQVSVIVATVKTSAESKDKEYRDRQNEYEQLLKNYGVSTDKEYFAGRQEYEIAQVRLESQNAQLKERGITNLDQARTEAERILRELDNQGITEINFPRDEIKRLQMFETKAREELHAVNDQLRLLTGSTNKSTGMVTGRLEPLNRDIVRLKSEIIKFQRERDQINLDHDAATVAIQILNTINADSQLKLQGLASEISHVLSTVISSSKVNVEAFDSKRIRCSDVSGAVRGLDELSTGCRDTFYFAARLALARKHAEGPQLLVLDEPFVSLDRVREKKMVTLLNKFRIETGWQIIFLTKDTELKNLLIEECSAVGYELSHIG